MQLKKSVMPYPTTIVSGANASPCNILQSRTLTDTANNFSIHTAQPLHA